MAIEKKDILAFISAEGHAASGYEEKLLDKFALFLTLPAVETVEEVVADTKKAKKADAEVVAE